jgi:hypothetical protein
MPDGLVNSLLLKPLPKNLKISNFIQKNVTGADKIAVLPYATAVLPRFTGATIV